MDGDTFQCIERCLSPFHRRLGQTTHIMLLWEGHQSSAQQACCLPSISQYPYIHLGQEEQVRVKCLAKDTTHGPHKVRTHNLGIMTPELYYVLSELCVFPQNFLGPHQVLMMIGSRTQLPSTPANYSVPQYFVTKGWVVKIRPFLYFWCGCIASHLSNYPRALARTCHARHLEGQLPFLMGKKWPFWTISYIFNPFWTILDGHSFKNDGQLQNPS